LKTESENEAGELAEADRIMLPEECSAPHPVGFTIPLKEKALWVLGLGEG